MISHALSAFLEYHLDITPCATEQRLDVESPKGQWSQTTCGNHADSYSKGAGSKACMVMYRYRQLPERIGLASMT